MTDIDDALERAEEDEQTIAALGGGEGNGGYHVGNIGGDDLAIKGGVVTVGQPTADRLTLAAEVRRLHSWDGLMSLLDEHWPADIFLTRPAPEDYHEPLYRRDPDGTPGQYVRANPGAIITGLIRWTDRLRREVEELRSGDG